MKILLTNDDGIDAMGLNILASVLREAHDIYVIAPHMERSGSSNAFTIQEPLTLFEKGNNSYAISGFPADCASVGIHGDIIPTVDLVISGINHGPNLGDDLFFSGTVGAARAAYIFGTPAIAVSIDDASPEEEYLRDTALFVRSFIETTPKDEMYLFNINYPHIPAEAVKGMRYTVSGRRNYVDTYDRTENSDGTATLQLRGEISSVKRVNSDHGVLAENWVSVTPLTIDSTDHDFLKAQISRESAS